MKDFVKRWLLPPGIADAGYSVFARLSRPSAPVRELEEESDEISLQTVMSDSWTDFRDIVSRSTRYAEYGSGESTVYVASYTDAQIRSIESDPAWVSLVERSLPRPAEVKWVDVGPTGRWGKPVSYKHRDKFSDYLEAPFLGGYSPDVVLIDGRFRVACFFTALLNSEPGTRIIIDDYASRPHYRIVETAISPDHIGARQALFSRPNKLQMSKIKALRDEFRMVMD